MKHLGKTLYLSALLLLLFTSVATLHGQEGTTAAPPSLVPTGNEPVEWSRPLPSRECPAGGFNCHYSSPVLADLTADGYLEIIVATNNGHVLAIDHQSAVLWDRDIAPAFGMAANSHEIGSSPAVADIDGDGRVEVVVGAGTIFADHCTQGGVVVLEHTGELKRNWPVLADDWETPPANCRDTVFSTPALGDLDGDGDMEIVSGGFDKRINAWHHDGTLVAGFPVDSVLAEVFPAWPNLSGRLADTIWSSPSLAMLDDDGRLDIVIGTDEGYFEVGDWECPYAPPPGWPSDYCGGSIYGLDRQGQRLNGNFPRHIYETIQSTPAVVDVDGDRRSEIFVGTGNFYYKNSPDRPTDGFRVFGWNEDGTDLPGWRGGNVVGGGVPASPSVGDITGDGRPEIVVATALPERKLYAWHLDGSLVPGFPMQPVDAWGEPRSNFDVGTGFVLADTDDDGAMEIVFNLGWEVAIVDGDGRQITAGEYPSSRPIYSAQGTLLNTPAAGDIDRDGRLELIAQNSALFVWELVQSSEKAAWPMFKHNAARTSNSMGALLGLTPTELQSITTGEGNDYLSLPLTIRNIGDGSALEWEIASTDQAVRFSESAGSAAPEETINILVEKAHLEPGLNNLGEVMVTASAENGVAGSPQSVPVRVWLVDELYAAYLPVLVR